MDSAAGAKFTQGAQNPRKQKARIRAIRVKTEQLGKRMPQVHAQGHMAPARRQFASLDEEVEKDIMRPYWAQIRRVH